MTGITETLRRTTFRGLSDALQVSIDTGNLGAAVSVMVTAHICYRNEGINLEQYAELKDDFGEAYPDITF